MAFLQSDKKKNKRIAGLEKSLEDALDTVDHANIMHLIREGAPINTKSPEGCTALHIAARTQNLSLFLLCLDHDADVHARDNDGWTAMHYAVREGADMFVDDLLKREAEVNPVDKYGRVPLHYAARFGASNMIEKLLRAGADYTHRDNKGHTPLDSAREFGSRETLSRLYNVLSRRHAEKVKSAYAHRHPHRKKAPSRGLAA